MLQLRSRIDDGYRPTRELSSTHDRSEHVESEVYRSEAGRSGKVACKRATKSPVLAAGAMGLVRRPGMGSNLVPVREAYKGRPLTGEQHGRGPSAFAPLRNVTSATREAFIGPVQRDW